MHKSKNMLVKLLILFFVLAVGVFVLTVAWFSSKQTATASGLTVASKKTEGLQVSFDKNKWDYNISENFSKSLPLITGDGTNFTMPALHINEGKLLNGSQGSKAESGTDYIDKTIYLRSQVPMTVSVTDIKVTPQVPNDKLSENANSKSAYGAFSKDYIAAAARVAIVKETKTETDSGTTTNTETFVYDPNPYIQLIGYGEYAQANGSLTNGNTVIFTDKDCYYALTATGNSLSDMPISMNSTNGEGNPVSEQMFTVVAGENGAYKFKLLSADSYLYYDSERDTFSLSATATSFTFENGNLKDSSSGKYLTYNGNTFIMTDTAPTSSKLKLWTSAPCTIVEGENNGAVAETYSGDVKTKLDGSPTIELSGTPAEDEFYYGEIKIRIWAEGTDRDALLPLKDGKFKTEIEFSGEVIKETQKTTAPAQT